MLAMPMVLGGALFFSGRSSYALVFVVGWPVIMLVTWLTNRRQQRKEFERELADWREDVDAVLTTSTTRPSSGVRPGRLPRRRDAPDPGRRARPLSVGARPDDDAFLVTRGHRSGAGHAPRRGSGGATGRCARGREVAAAVLDQMPVTMPVLEHSVIALTGEPDAVDAAVRAMLLRLAFDHSPAELSVAACSDAPAAP